MAAGPCRDELQFVMIQICCVAFMSVLKAASAQPCQVTGRISASIMKYVIKVLVNKANVLSSSTYSVDLEIVKSLR